MYKLIDKVLVEQPKMEKPSLSDLTYANQENGYEEFCIDRDEWERHITSLRKYPASEALIATGKVDWEEGEFEVIEEYLRLPSINSHSLSNKTILVAYPLDEVKEEDVFIQFLEDAETKDLTFLKTKYNLTRK